LEIKIFAHLLEHCFHWLIAGRILDRNFGIIFMSSAETLWYTLLRIARKIHDLFLQDSLWHSRHNARMTEQLTPYLDRKHQSIKISACTASGCFFTKNRYHDKKV
jgi:hypothetical protein